MVQPPTNPFGPNWLYDKTSSPPPSAQSTTSTKASLKRTASGEIKSAQPQRTFFDPWNSASTGHQRAENRLQSSTSWRDSRSKKLSAQYSAGSGGGRRVQDTVGAGSEGFGRDGRKANGGWERGASGLRVGGQRSILESFVVGKGGTSKEGKEKVEGEESGEEVEWNGFFHKGLGTQREIHKADDPGSVDDDHERILQDDEPGCEDQIGQRSSQQPTPSKPGIFTGLTIYLNGSTYPLISDHKLKHMLAEHGAHLSIALGRRTVTHVILGTTCTNGGAGGGLASTKIQKEIAQVRGKGVKFVSAEWVIESVKAGKRLPESRFSGMRLAAKGQGSVLGAFARVKS